MNNKQNNEIERKLIERNEDLFKLDWSEIVKILNSEKFDVNWREKGKRKE